MLRPYPSGSGCFRPGGSFGLAMVFVLLTFGGWNEAAYISAELREGKNTMVHVLLWGIGAITVIYLLAGVAFFKGLGLDAMGCSDVVAADLMRKVFGEGGAKICQFPDRRFRAGGNQCNHLHRSPHQLCPRTGLCPLRLPRPLAGKDEYSRQCPPASGDNRRGPGAAGYRDPQRVRNDGGIHGSRILAVFSPHGCFPFCAAFDGNRSTATL